MVLRGYILPYFFLQKPVSTVMVWCLHVGSTVIDIVYGNVRTGHIQYILTVYGKNVAYNKIEVQISVKSNDIMSVPVVLACI